MVRASGPQTKEKRNLFTSVPPPLPGRRRPLLPPGLPDLRELVPLLGPDLLQGRGEVARPPPEAEEVAGHAQLRVGAALDLALDLKGRRREII